MVVIRKNLTWQYNGVAPWQELADWCKLNLPDQVWYITDTMYFDNEAAYSLFLLRWS